MTTRPQSLGVDYWKLWTAATVSNLGDGIRFAALPLLAATITSDPILVAGTVVASQLPWLLVAIVSGALVDRLDRRVVMWTANLFRAVAMGLLGLMVHVGSDHLILIYLIVFSMGVAETFFDSASLAMIPSLVKESDLERANGPLEASIAFNQTFAGPPLGALLFALAASSPFFVDAASFAVGAVIVVSIKGSFRPEEREGPLFADLRTGIWEGIRWVWQHQALSKVMIIAAAANMVFYATFSIRVLFAREVLGLDSRAFGILMAAEGAGAIVGAILAGRVSAKVGRGHALLMVLVVLIFSNVMFGLMSSPIIAGIALAVGGAGVSLWNVVVISIMQSVTPDRLLGRMMSVLNTVSWGAIPVGAALGGVVARAFDLRLPYILGAAIVVLTVPVALRLVAALEHGTDIA